MANRYRVGTGGGWNSTTYWSTSSGGSGGASVPGSGDNAIFDGSTPVGTVTVDVAVDIVNLTCTGWTGTLDQNGYTMQISGNWTVPTGMTFVGNGLVQFDGSATQSLVMDCVGSNWFDDLQSSNSSADVDVLSDIRITGIFTIDVNCRVDTGIGPYDVFIRGGGGSQQLVLNGWMYALTGSIVFEINTGGTTYLPGFTGWNVNGSLTGCIFRVDIIANITATVRMSGDMANFIIFTIRPLPAVTSATVAFYTDNYDIDADVNINIGGDNAAENDACAFTSYWGSSTIIFTHTASQFIRWIWSGATHNLQTATFTSMAGGTGEGGQWSVGGPSTGWVDVAQTFNVGTSQVFCRYTGESWMGLGAHDGVAEFYDLTLSYNGGVSIGYIETIVHNQMVLDDNGSSSETSVEWQAHYDIEDLIVTALYANVVWEGYEGTGLSYFRNVPTVTGPNDFQIRSRVPTSQAPVQNDEAGQALTYTDVQDSNLTGYGIDMTAGTNTDSGNNSSLWWFTLPTAPTKAYHYRRRRV